MIVRMSVPLTVTTPWVPVIRTRPTRPDGVVSTTSIPVTPFADRPALRRRSSNAGRSMRTIHSWLGAPVLYGSGTACKYGYRPPHTSSLLSVYPPESEWYAAKIEIGRAHV